MENKQIWIIALAVILVFFLFGLFGMMPFGNYGMMGSYEMTGDYWPGGVFMGYFMMIIWLLIIVALVLGIIWLVKQNQKNN